MSYKRVGVQNQIGIIYVLFVTLALIKSMDGIYTVNKTSANICGPFY